MASMGGLGPTVHIAAVLDSHLPHEEVQIGGVVDPHTHRLPPSTEKAGTASTRSFHQMVAVAIQQSLRDQSTDRDSHVEVGLDVPS